MIRSHSAALIAATAAALATPECVWAFLAIARLPAAWPASLNVVQFVSSGVLQLVALPVLAVAGSLDARRLARQADEQHRAAMAMLAEMHAIHREMRAATR